MAEASSTFLAKKRYAVVTGANRGIGLEICRQLASKGVVVILTARDENKGIEAFENLKNSCGRLINSDNIHFHQLDVTNPTSIASLSHFLRHQFGILDILVNNAGISGVIADFNALKASRIGTPQAKVSYDEMVTQTYEMAEQCLKTNYYGVKTTVEALLPLLHLSDSPRIVNVSSSAGQLQNIPSERVRELLGNPEKLAEEIVEKVLKEFLRDFKDGSLSSSLAEKGWPPLLPAYRVSKAALNAYTRTLANKYPSIVINSICPGSVKTDINGNTGHLSVEEGGETPVRLALMPHASPSGFFFDRNEISSF